MPRSKIDLKIRLVAEMIQLWQELQLEIDAALESPHVDEESEDRCMAHKTKIAQRSQLAKEMLGGDYTCHGAVEKVLLGIPTLDLFKRQSPIIVANLRNVWHDAYIALNQLAGNLRVVKETTGSSSKAKGGSFFKRLLGRS